MLTRALRPSVCSARSYAKRTDVTTFNLEKDWAKYVFNEEAMRNRVPGDIFKRFQRSLKEKTPIDPEVANTIAHAMKEWALSHGATHFAHWFQPLTGWTAEKHDSFISLQGGSVTTLFKGKTLIGGEPDASSFPNGGLRPTHHARGYTIWDPQTPAWIMTEGGVPTLCIPTCFYSYAGHALDRKTPLLRSQGLLQRSAQALFAAIDEDGHDEIFSDSGVEQEFFIVRESLALKRPDIVAAGRTLQGTHPAKTQQLNDHYFAPIPSHALQYLHEVEESLWKLGVPLTTRHQEVAPNQFEFAPIFQRSSIASDYNMLAMEVIRRVAEKQNLTVLLHEKPFARINGSGKHNNWSVGTTKRGTLFEPGNDPANDNLFLLSVAAVLRGVDLHQDLIRWACAGIGNDHRLGGHEAPPAIVSVYLGDFVGALVDAFIEGKPVPPPIDPNLDLGVSYLPKRDRDNTDRNRTSPVAFTGNKFEIRCVGSSQQPSFSNFIINTIVSDSFNSFTKDILKKREEGKSIKDAVHEVVKDTFTKHKRIVQNGDGYSQEWQEEAQRRGLLNLRNTIQALDHVNNKENREFFDKLGILSEEEFDAHIAVDYTSYCQTALLEAQCLRDMSNTHIIPASIRYLNKVLQNEKYTPEGLKKKLSKLINEAWEKTEKLDSYSKRLTELGDNSEGAHYARENVVRMTKDLRVTLDELEDYVEASEWPFPTYEELLLSRNTRESSE